MAIPVQELIARLQTYPPEALVEIYGDYDGEATLHIPPDDWNIGPIIYDNTSDEEWDQGEYVAEKTGEQT